MTSVGTHRLPRRLVRTVRNGYLACLDFVERIGGRSDELTPPRTLHFVGGGDFRAVGNAFVEHFKSEARLKPSEAVLDIGCGTGRMAVPLLGYLEATGSYTGFDISRQAIAWCTRRISARNPRFRFEFADIYNLEYNPGGTIKADQYQFPAGNDSIDFEFATSVFTHMHSQEIRHYLAEIRRTLRRGGRALLTFFIADGSRDGAALDFRFRVADGWTIDPNTPERAIAYPEAWLRGAFDAAGLVIQDPIRHGSWSGERGGLDFQDIILAHRRDAP